jgi:hypothetical protein
MNKSQEQRLLLMPSIADILSISIFLYLALVAGESLLADCDTGYHIRAGEYMIDTHSIPKNDIFSFTNPAIPWTAHEWLSEVIMAAIHGKFGLTGVVIFFSFVIAAVYYVLFRILKSSQAGILVTVAVALLVVGSSQLHWLARPHIFSLLLTLLWYYVLDRYEYEERNYLYLLPAVMLLWVNLHGGFILGFVLTGIYLAGNFLKFLVAAPAEEEKYAGKVRSLGILAGACLLVALINPHGYHLLLFPFRLASNRFIMDNVHEFLSPNFHEPMTFTYLLFFLIAVLAVSRKRINFIELILLLLFTYMALYSARYIPIFAIITGPILVKQAGLILKESEGRIARFLKRMSERIALVDASARGIFWPAVAVAVVVFFFFTGKITYHFDQKMKPVQAVDFLKKEHLEGNMFDNDEFGDYIIYAAWPEYKVFFDGRSDMYGVERMKEYFRVIRIEEGWEDVLKKYKINWIIYDAKSVLSRFLLGRDDWKLIYADKVADIFMRNVPENAQMIEKYKDTKPYKDVPR